MNVVITGCGSIGARHARNVRALGHTVYLSDVDQGRAVALADALGVGLVTPAADWWPDAVLVCTPASTHAAVAREILNTGYPIPIFVEKPLALSVEECAIFKDWPYPTTMVGYNLRHHHMARGMRAMFREPVSGRFYVHSDMRQWPGQAYADPILEYSHEIDLALWMGAPATVSGARLKDTDIFFMLGEWSIGIGWQSPTSERRWEVSRGFMGYAQCFDDQQPLGDQMYVDEIAHFLDCAQRGVATDTPFADGIRVLDVIEQAKAMAACAS